LAVSYSLTTIWHDAKRFLPGIIAVAFSTVLILFQGGLLVGQFFLTSTPIDHSSADIWVGHPMNLSVDLGRSVPERWLARVAVQPEVVQVETYIIGMVVIDRGDGRSELCTVVGSSLEDNALGAVRQLTPELRRLLSEPGAVIADQTELGRLGFEGVGDIAEVVGRRVRLVGVVQGVKSLAAPYLFCSVQTSRILFQGIDQDQTVFILARCRHPASAQSVAQRLRQHYAMSAFTSEEFSVQTRVHWMVATKAGVTAVWSAILGLLIGLAITCQTLYAATASSWREFAVLEALGIPTRRMVATVLAQSSWVGVAGLAIAAPVTLTLADLLGLVGMQLLFPVWLVAPAAGMSMVTVLLSGLVALRSLRLVQPAELLR
jgi:putative ABC transport system permease protein